jgi:hypothetical protein
MAKKSTPTQKVYRVLKEVDVRVKKLVLSGIFQMRATSGKVADMGKKRVVASISQKGSYKPYYKKGKLRYSSQPGNPPAADKDGDLMPSIYSEIKSKPNQNPAVSEFGSTAPFARKLEFGTTSVPARPFMLPARQQIVQIVRPIVMSDLGRAYAKKAKTMKPVNIDFDMGA